MNVIEFISQPWHWSVSGLMIVFVMFLLLYFGERFGVSSNLRTICAISGAGKKVPFFNFDWKSDVWNLVFIGGAVIGGFIAYNYLKSPNPVDISDSTIAFLNEVGVLAPAANPDGLGYLPSDIFNFDFLLSGKGLIILVLGGFLVGFGTRYAGGCTSGHAISGLSNLQLPSLIAVVGFFIGGLAMTHFLLPIILK